MGGRGRDWKPLPFLQATLGDSAQRQDVKADVADADWLVQVELDDGDLLGRALVAQQTPTVPAARKERGLMLLRASRKRGGGTREGLFFPGCFANIRLQSNPLWKLTRVLRSSL